MWVESMVFSREVAVLAAQIAPVLVIAFVIEVRAIGERMRVGRGDGRLLLGVSFGCFVLLLGFCLYYVNGPEMLSGREALVAWVQVTLPLLALVLYVGRAAFSALNVASDSAAEDTERAARLDEHLNEPGWKWLLRGRR